MNNAPILVLGSTGKTGRRVAQKLEKLGRSVRPGSRSAALPFDWEDSSTWAPALDGVSAVYVSFFPDLAVPGADEAIRRLTELAAEASVQRLVLLSGRGEDAAEACERIVLESSIPQTSVVRAAWFMQNFDEGAFTQLVRDGVLALPVPPDAVEPFVDAEDIADVAVAALTEDGHEGQMYDLTGPRLISWTEVASELSEAIDRPIRFLQVPSEDFRRALSAEAGDDFASLVTELCELLTDGRNAHLGDGVRRALGREARDFRDYVSRSRETGVWDQEVAP